MLYLCPICAAEFEPAPALCPTCGCALVPASLSDLTTHELDIETLSEVKYVELCRPRSFTLALLIKETLERNDIPVLVQGGHSISVLPHLAFEGELRVLVDRRQLNYARELY